MKNLLVTGALGFIGSNFVNHMSEKYNDIKIVILDKQSYCSSITHIGDKYSGMIELVIGDIQNKELVTYILNKFHIDHVIHFAAESHVDNSYFNSLSFTLNNVYGTHNLLECLKIYQDQTNRLQKIIHVSTDEVYGETPDGVEKCEKSILNPTNPYAASKAAAEAFVKAYQHSYKLPIIITRGNNVYGPQQYPEKLIPKFICHLLHDEKLTIQGTGDCKRSFIHVADVVKAFEKILIDGVIGEIYNIGSYNQEYSVMEVAQTLLDLFGKTDDINEYITFVEDRKFNDCRYLIKSSKLEELGWKLEHTDFVENLKELIEWYKENKHIYFDKK